MGRLCQRYCLGNYGYGIAYGRPQGFHKNLGLDSLRPTAGNSVGNTVRNTVCNAVSNTIETTTAFSVRSLIDMDQIGQAFHSRLAVPHTHILARAASSVTSCGTASHEIICRNTGTVRVCGCHPAPVGCGVRSSGCKVLASGFGIAPPRETVKSRAVKYVPLKAGHATHSNTHLLTHSHTHSLTLAHSHIPPCPFPQCCCFARVHLL